MTETPQRYVRQIDAPAFFAVSRGKFNSDFRPHLQEIPLGNTPQAGIAYDIYDLHALADIIKERNGRPALKGEGIWDVKQQVSNSLKEKIPLTGTLKGRSSSSVLEKALAPHRKKMQP